MAYSSTLPEDLLSNSFGYLYYSGWGIFVNPMSVKSESKIGCAGQYQSN